MFLPPAGGIAGTPSQPRNGNAKRSVRHEYEWSPRRYRTRIFVALSSLTACHGSATPQAIVEPVAQRYAAAEHIARPPRPPAAPPLQEAPVAIALRQAARFRLPEQPRLF